MIITLQDTAKLVRPDGKRVYCRSGLRKFFKKYGLDYYLFRHGGLDEKEFLKTNDTLAIKFVERIRKLKDCNV